MSKFYGQEALNDVLTGIKKNAFSFVDEATKSLDDYIALTYYGRNISYKTLKTNIIIYANNLLSFGLKKGDSITVLLPNTPELVYYYYSAWVLGVTVSPIDPRTNPDGIKQIINSTKSKLLVAILDKYSEKVSPILNDINLEKIIIVSPTDSMNLTFKCGIGKAIYKYKEFYLNHIDADFSSDRVSMNRRFINNSNNAPIEPVYEDSPLGMPAVNLFTSGTEGSPKTAVHSHEAYNIKAKQILHALPKVVPGDKFLGIIPFFSAYGSFQGMHNCLYRGMNMILIPRFEPKDVPELICKYKPSTVIAVPNYWHDFSERIDELMRKHKLQDLSFLVYPISGGDKQPAKDVKTCNEIFGRYNSDAKLMRGYGATEVGGAIATTVDDLSYEDYEYTGIPFPGTEYRINSNESGEGEIYISDPSLMIEYLDNETETSNSIVRIDGKRYMKMGDLFSCDKMDRLYFKGRIKRAMMRPDGHTVHALPIEAVLEKNHLVKECCVVGVSKKDGTSGTIPTAFVVLDEKVERSYRTAKKLDIFSLRFLSERNRALAYMFVDELPRTLMDKVDYKRMEKNYIEDLDIFVVDASFFTYKHMH